MIFWLFMETRSYYRTNRVCTQIESMTNDWNTYYLIMGIPKDPSNYRKPVPEIRVCIFPKKDVHVIYCRAKPLFVPGDSQRSVLRSGNGTDLKGNEGPFSRGHPLRDELFLFPHLWLYIFIAFSTTTMSGEERSFRFETLQVHAGCVSSKGWGGRVWWTLKSIARQGN